jgi:hypothetical protein
VSFKIKFGVIMTRLIYSFFVLALLFSLYGCQNSSTTASRGMDLGNQRLDLL